MTTTCDGYRGHPDVHCPGCAALAAAEARATAAEADAQGGREYHETFCQEADKATRTAEARAVRAEGQVAELRAAIGMDEPYSALACLDQLAIAADHLLKGHDCDAHGWEGVGFARDYARQHHAALSSWFQAHPPAAPLPGEPAATPAEWDCYSCGKTTLDDAGKCAKCGRAQAPGGHSSHTDPGVCCRCGMRRMDHFGAVDRSVCPGGGGTFMRRVDAATTTPKEGTP